MVEEKEESAAWWLNVVLLLVILAIAGLLYVLMQQGSLKGMNMDKIWSYFSPPEAVVVEASVAPATTEPVVVVETEVVEVIVEPAVEETENTTPEAGLKALPVDQQQLLWEALMLPPDNQ